MRVLLFSGLIGLLVVGLSGCGHSTAESSAISEKPREEWHALYIKGQWAGYVHEVERSETEGSQPVVIVEMDSRTAMKRNGEETEVTMKVSSVETGDGRLISFRDETLIGASPTITHGRVEGGKLLLTTEVAGKESNRTLDWPKDAGGFSAPEQSLLRKPMQPGERRKLRYLVPMLNVLCTEEMEARDVETTEFMSGMKDLLRIDCNVSFDGGASFESVRWTDGHGELMKTEIWAMRQVSYRTTREEALGKDATISFDVFDEALVSLSQPLENPRSLKRVRYRVELERGDPARQFAGGPAQQVKSTGDHTAELTVTSIDTQDPSCAGEATLPTDADRQPNDTIQSDDERIVRMAREAAGDLEHSTEIALALEKFVYEKMKAKTNYKVALATAADVVQTLEGDCTEHAMLLAALARALNIPARVAMGLVYAPQHQGFAYHMWTEIYLSGCWVPLDATLGEGVVPADHIKLAHSNLANGMSSFLSLINVLGQLKIEVLEAK